MITPLFVVAYFSSQKAQAQMPSTINFQGKIVRNDSGYEGMNVTTGSPACVQAGADTCDFQVKYYSASSGGTLFLTETFADKEIGQYGGVFELSLGSGSITAGSHATLDSMIQNENTIYVEIGFSPAGNSTFTETFTRMYLQANAFAIRSKYSEMARGAFKFENAANSSGYSGSDGMVYYDTTTGGLKLYSAGVWLDISTGTASSLWGTDDISSYSHSPSQFLETSGIATLSNFGLDTTLNRAWIHGTSSRTGFSVYSNYGGATDWPLVTFKADASNFGNSILQLIQDGTGSILEGYKGSNKVFDVDNRGDMHLSSDGILYIEPFAGLPSSGNLFPASGEGCLYSTGGNIYWDSGCDASAPTMLNAASSSLWTDAGSFTYLTSTSDNLVLGGNSVATATFFFDMTGASGRYFRVDNYNNTETLFTIDSSGNVGIGTATPSAKLDIGGSSANISNAIGDITIIPAQNLIISQGNVGIGNSSPTSLLSVGSSSQFQVNSSGDLVRINNLAYTWPTSHVTNSLLVNDGTGELRWRTPADAGVASGTGVAGQVTFWSGTSTIAGDNNLWWDNVNKRLGIGTTTPQATIDIAGASSEIANTSGNISIIPAQTLVLDGDVLFTGTSKTIYINNSRSYSDGFITGSSYSGIYRTTNAAGNPYPFDTGTHANLVIQARSSASKDIVFVTGTTPTVRVVMKGNGRFGVGVDTPASNFHMRWADSGAGGGMDVGGQLMNDAAVFENSGNIHLQLMPGGSSYSSNINFSMPTNAAHGAIKYNYTGSPGGVANGFGFWTNGNVFRMALDSSGNLGIGVSSPSYKLDVDGHMRLGSTITGNVSLHVGANSTHRYLQILNDGQASGVKLGGLLISDSYAYGDPGRNDLIVKGNVGIGTASPSSKVQIVGGTGLCVEVTDTSCATGITGIGAGDIVVGDTSMTFMVDASANIVYQQRSTTDVSAPSYVLRKSRGTTAAPTTIVSGDDIAYFRGYAYAGSTPAWTESTRIHFDTEGTIGNGIAPGLMRFYTSNSSGTVIQRMYINSNGNVDIATPTAGSTLSLGRLGGNASIKSTESWLIMDSNTNPAALNYFVSQPVILGYGNNTHGNVGLGVLSPPENLTVKYYGRFNHISSTAWFTFRQYFSAGTYIEIDTPGGFRGISTFASSQVYKKNITDLEIDSSLIYNLRPTSFNWKTDSAGTPKTFGLIAEEVEKYIPELVRYRENGEILSVVYELISVLNMKELQKHEKQIKEIQGTLASINAPVGNAVGTITGQAGWYRVAKADSDQAFGRIRISNTSLGSSQNSVLEVNRMGSESNINIISNFISGGNNFSKVRINNVNGVTYLEMYIENTNNNIVKVLPETGSGWSVVSFTYVGSNTTTKEYSLNNILLGVSDNFAVTKDGLTTSGTLYTSGMFSDIGNSGNRWNDIYTKGTIRLGSGSSEGGIRYNVEKKRLEFSNDGINWVEMGDLTSNVVISPEYSGAILYADGSDNHGRMTSDAINTGGVFKNYYEWKSDRETLQDYDILVRITLPSDFVSWKEDAIALDFMTENSASITNNKVEIALMGDSGIDTETKNGISKMPGAWERMTLKAVDITQCKKAGDSCTLRLSMYSKENYYVRVGDISLNYNRGL